MATGSILLPNMAAQPPDSAGPALSVAKGTHTAPERFSLIASFDAAADQHLWWTIQVPDNYASGGTFRLVWEANATSGSAVWGASVGAVTAGDADTPIEHNQSTATTTTTAANATEARRLVETTIAPSMDSMAPDDLVTVLIYRDANNGSDSLSLVANLWSVILEYTTT